MDWVAFAVFLLIVWSCILLPLLIDPAVVSDPSLFETRPPYGPTPTENIYRIGLEARKTMDKASESFLSQVEDLLTTNLGGDL